ncbi:uncharacterized protein LOC130657669 isoform X2 [Hydractinia symbiolongicarpus]|uniref:uncharacterized protein LOC130657669 isoform X2 n=1 Tax=Hydractinia symbiolongicarpus TaxID=13093 RepID=UPI0025519FA5|nr:uncharacterized protein LOC130657669 isoform X2 [Hydractinia symbiolongicarpus]
MAARAALSTIYLLLIYFCCVSLREPSYDEDHYNDPNGYEDGDYLSMPQDYEENDNSDEDPEEDDNYDNPHEEEADDENDEYGRTKVGITEHALYNGGIRDVHDHIMEDKHPNVEKKNKKKKKKKKSGKKKKISQHNKKNRNKQNTPKTSDPHTAAIPRLTPSASIQPIKPASVVKHEEESNHKHIETIINTASDSPENDKHDVPPKEEFKNDQEKTDSLEQPKDAGLQESAQDKKNDAEKRPQKQIKMATLSDPDLEMNSLLQSEKFSHVRETQIRDYINSHFPGQDLQDDVLDMIDNLITSNLRNELRNKDSRLNRILHEKETTAQDGDQQSTSPEPEKVNSDTVDEPNKNIADKQDPASSPSSVADVTSKSVVVEPTPVLEDPQVPFEKHIPEAIKLVEQPLSTYKEAITQIVEPTPSLSNVPTESSSVENIVDASKVEDTSSLPVVEASTTDPHKVKRKNLMKQALKGMHFNAHHLHDHHTDKKDATKHVTEESSSKDVNFDELNSNHHTEEEEKRTEAVDVTSESKEVPIDSEAANKESKNGDLVNEVDKKTEKEEAFSLKPPDYSKKEIFTNVLKKEPEISPHSESADSLLQHENFLSSDKKVDDLPSPSEQLKENNIPSIKLPLTTQDQTNLESEKETTIAANVSDVTDTPPSNSDADSTAGNILPDEKPVSKGEEGKGAGFLGGLFDYFSSESAGTEEKTGSEENKAEKTESTLMGINEVDEASLMGEIDRTGDHKDIAEADTIKTSLFSEHDKENEGEKDKPTITSAAENVETTVSSPTESTATRTTTATMTTPTEQPTTEPPTTEPPTTTSTLATETPKHAATILATEKHSVEESDTQASENPTLETTKSPTTQQSATPLSTASIEVPVTIVPSVKTEEVKEEKETVTRLDDKTPNQKENDMKDMLNTYRESVDMDHEKAKYLPTGQNTETEAKQTGASTTTSSSNKNQEASTTEILPDFDDDDPLKKLCQTHPTLQACKRKPTKKPQTEPPLSSSPSTASYVKSFTCWFNGTLYTIFVYLFTCLKMVSTTIVNSSLGMFLSVTGQTEASKNLSSYMDSVSLERFALFMVLLVNHVAFYWYFKNSSMGPQVKSITRSDTNPKNDLKLQELEENTIELEKKLSKETKQKEELEKKVVKMEDKMKNQLDEIKELKEKLEDEKANKEIIEKLQAATEEYKEKLASKETELNNKTSSLEAKKEDLDNSKTEFKQLEDKFFYVIKELDTKDAAIMRMEDKEKELQQKISEKESTLSEKEETIDEQKNRIEVLLEEKITLENNIKEETKKSHSLAVEIQVLQESLLAVNKTHVDHETSSEFETVEEDEEIDDQLKADRLAKIMDATKTQAELKELTSELETCREELDRYKERVVDVEGKYMDVSTRYDSVYVEAGEVRKELEKKEIELTTIRKFFNDRENDYQKASASQSEELRVLRKQVDSIGDNDKQINILMKQVQDLKDEIVKNEKDLKEQISSAEEQSHNSYIKMRTAVRECDEHKREKEIYRKRLLDIDMSPQFKKSSTPLSSKTSSERAVSPTNSNKSNDDNSGTESPHPTLPPPVPSPYAPRMYPGMPPPFQHRPPFGMPMGPYGGPPRPPFMSPMGQRPGGMTRIPTTAATSKEDQLQQMGTATLEQRPLLPPNPAALPPHMASPMRPMSGMYRMPPPGTPPMVRPPYGMPPGTPPMMRAPNTFAPGAQQLQPQSNVNTPSGNGQV